MVAACLSSHHNPDRPTGSLPRWSPPPSLVGALCCTDGTAGRDHRVCFKLPDQPRTRNRASGGRRPAGSHDGDLFGVPHRATERWPTGEQFCPGEGHTLPEWGAKGQDLDRDGLWFPGAGD
jgi:hypothetical protein